MLVLALAVVPGFAAVIGLELLAARRLGRPVYRFDDAVSNLATGAVAQVVTVAGAAWIVGVYALIHDHLRLASLPVDRPWVWITCAVGFDLAYYIYHRLAHRVAALWAAHAPHHHSREFNVTVALRQGALQPLFSCVFYWPLALLGFPPLVFFGAGAVVTLYGVLIHTRLVPRLGVIGWLLVTPSHHRVHHACNPRYLDRNFGAMLIVWDRLLGTFAGEDDGDEVVFGTGGRRPLEPLTATLIDWIELARSVRHRGWRALWSHPPPATAPSEFET